MSPPLLLLAGRRKSGKDTAAAILSRVYRSHTDAFADGFKAFAASAFGLPRPWVWGPSELREQVILGTEDPRGVVWSEAESVFKGRDGARWLIDLFGDLYPGRWRSFYWEQASDAQRKLGRWFDELRADAGKNDGLTVRHLLQQLGTEFGRNLIHADVWQVTGQTRALRVARGGGHPLAVITDGRFANEVEGVRRAGGHVVRLIDPTAPPPGLNDHPSERDLDNVPPGSFAAIIYNDKSKGVAAFEGTLRRVVSELFPDVKER